MTETMVDTREISLTMHSQHMQGLASGLFRVGRIVLRSGTIYDGAPSLVLSLASLSCIRPPNYGLCYSRSRLSFFFSPPSFSRRSLLSSFSLHFLTSARHVSYVDSRSTDYSRCLESQSQK
jgi:hypothetical protein